MKMHDGFSSMVERYAVGGPRVGVTSQMLDQAFRSSPWYGKILTVPVDDAVREWRSWQAEADQIERIEAEEARLSVQQVVRQALTLARHQGGALILALGLPGEPETPVRLGAIGRGDLTRFIVLGKHDVVAEELDRDPLSEGYGLPRMWRLNGSGASVRVHPSRTVMIQGHQLPGQSVRTGELWGVPLYERLGQVIEAAEAGGVVLADLLSEAKLDIVTIPGMVDMLLSDEGEQAFMRRWEAVARLKNFKNVLLLDGGPQPEGTGEAWDQKELSWGGLPEVARTLLTIMAGAADISLTRLTGEQQVGLSGTDSGSLRNYYDGVAAGQKLDLAPAIAPMDDWLVQSALGERPRDIWYRWNPLYQMDEKEMAEIDKLQADTAMVYAQSALVDEEQLAKAVTNRMIESGRWPGMEPVETESPGLGWGADDSQPQTLYVSRKVLNAEEILAWAAEQGFTETLEADDLHVTIAYSRTPVDWMAMGVSWEANLEVPEGGPRVMETFGEAQVLLFSSSELIWRHEFMKEMGATWDHPEYQPHITICYGDMPADVEPYRGRIVLGPEIFEEVNENWRPENAEP